MNNPINTPLIWLSEQDPWTAQHACEGTLITGSPGSGKSSTSSKEIAYRFLEEGYGGLVLCHKVSEPDTWLEYCEKTGRSQDVILFSEESGHCFDFLSYEWNRQDKGSADTETLIQLLSMLTGSGGATGKDKFWEEANKKLMRHTMKLIGLSKKPLSITSMNDVIQSLPRKLGDHDDQDFRDKSECIARFMEVKERINELSESECGDLYQAQQFLLFKWARLAEQTSSSVEMHWAALADQFLFDPFRRLFCSGECSFVPEQTTHLMPGKIVIVAFPTLAYGETGSVINRLMKVAFQKAWLRRDVKKYPNITFSFQDEFQTFLLPGHNGSSWDNQVQQVCRDRKIANIYITQNILNLAEVLGEQQTGSRTKSFCGNIRTRIMHQQNDVDTQLYCSDLIGKEYRMLKSIGIDQARSHIGGNEHLVHRVEPDVFSRLETSDKENAFSEAIIYQGGKVFEATGLNYHRRTFSRDIEAVPFVRKEANEQMQ